MLVFTIFLMFSQNAGIIPHLVGRNTLKVISLKNTDYVGSGVPTIWFQLG